MKKALVLAILLLACRVEQQASEDKALLRAGGKIVRSMTDALSPKVKTLVKSGATSGDYDQLLAMLKAGKNEGKAAARAFKNLVEIPVAEVDILIERLGKTTKSNPLSAKIDELLRKDLNDKLDKLSEALEQHHKAIKSLKESGLSTRSLQVKMHVLQAQKWKKNLKKKHPELFTKTSALNITIDKSTAVLAGVGVAAGVQLSLEEFMNNDD